MTKKLKENFNEIQSLLKQLNICKHVEVKLRSEAKISKASPEDDENNENDELKAMYMQLREENDDLAKKYGRLQKRYATLKKKVSAVGK